MRKYILVYGVLAGLVIIGNAILWTILKGDETSTSTLELLGYLVMLIALSVIFIGVKRYRDQELGGVIRFATAALLGLGIAAVAGVIYVAVWEIYLALTDYAFIQNYTRAIIEEKTAAGVRGDELQMLLTEMAAMRESYAQPLRRLPMTFLEIFPVGALVALISAAVLRKSEVLPANA